MNTFKAALLAPLVFAQLVVWLYLTIAFSKIWIWSIMSWEQDLNENWIILQVAYFIWTNQLIVIYKSKGATASK